MWRAAPTGSACSMNRAIFHASVLSTPRVRPISVGLAPTNPASSSRSVIAAWAARSTDVASSTKPRSPPVGVPGVRPPGRDPDWSEEDPISCILNHGGVRPLALCKILCIFL